MHAGLGVVDVEVALIECAEAFGIEADIVWIALDMDIVSPIVSRKIEGVSITSQAAGECASRRLGRNLGWISSIGTEGNAAKTPVVNAQLVVSSLLARRNGEPLSDVQDQPTIFWAPGQLGTWG